MILIPIQLYVLLFTVFGFLLLYVNCVGVSFLGDYDIEQGEPVVRTISYTTNNIIS